MKAQKMYRAISMPTKRIRIAAQAHASAEAECVCSSRLIMLKRTPAEIRELNNNETASAVPIKKSHVTGLDKNETSLLTRLLWLLVLSEPTPAGNT